MNKFAFVCSGGIDSDACQGFGDGLVTIFLLGLAAILAVVILVGITISAIYHKKRKSDALQVKRKHSTLSVFMYSTFLGLVTIAFGSYLIIAFDLNRIVNLMIVLVLLALYIFAIRSFTNE